MKVLITGAKGFLGKNLTSRLNELGGYEVYAYDVENTLQDLEKFTRDCEFVFNFAAVHRPKEVTEFDRVNHLLFDELLELLKKHGNNCPVLYTSSIQATNGTEYGNSKLAAEADLKKFGEMTGARAIIYRLTNVFGRWATPNHHSVVATFCNNLAQGLPLQISNRDILMNFYYIDDVISSFVSQLNGEVAPDCDGIYRLAEDKIYSITLGDLADTLTEISEIVREGQECSFKGIKDKLYKTYLSYYDAVKNKEKVLCYNK